MGIPFRGRLVVTFEGGDHVVGVAWHAEEDLRNDERVVAARDEQHQPQQKELVRATHACLRVLEQRQPDEERPEHEEQDCLHERRSGKLSRSLQL